MTMYNVDKLVLYMYVVSIESKKWYFLLFWHKRDFLSYMIIRHLHDFMHLPIFPHSRLIRTTRLLGTLEYRTVKGYVYLFGTVIKIKLLTKPFMEPKICNKEACMLVFFIFAELTTSSS